jgi:hypothetical protein
MPERTYNTQNLKRWPKGTLPPGLHPGAPRLPEHRCSHPGCGRWRMHGTTLCYRHNGRTLSTVRQSVARRRNRQPKVVAMLAERDAKRAIAKALRDMPEGLQQARAWARALALAEGPDGPRTVCLAALVLAWGNPEAWARAIDLLQAAERGEVTGRGGDMRGALGSSGVV